jgi:hypothetical protein
MTSKQASPKGALVDLFMVGAVGAFFVALASNIPVDIQNLPVFTNRPVDWTYALNRIVRYEYLLWFLMYFFVSNLRRKRQDENPESNKHERYDVFFYLAQSVLSLGAVFYLGMLVSNEGFERYGYAVLAADIAIGSICLLSLWYWKDNGSKCKLNALRVVGFLLACVSVRVAYLAQHAPSSCYLMLLFSLATGLLLAAGLYVRLRLAASS